MFGFFHKWGGPTGYIYDSVERSGSRLMLHISTQDGYGTPEAVTPRGIANGEGDRYLIRTNRRDRRLRQARRTCASWPR